MKIIDLHNHTHFSYDGQNSINEVIENAVANGVDVIGITDHQFSIGDRIGEYIYSVNKAKEKYRDKITVLCGLEIGTRPMPNDFPVQLSEKLDYCIFESLDDDRAMDLYEFFEWKRLFKCSMGLAHTDIFKLCDKYGVDLLKILKRDNIFWEVNFSGNYLYYYDFISNREKQRLVSESGIKVSVGSDLHWVGDFNLCKLTETNELVRKLKNPMPLGIID